MAAAAVGEGFTTIVAAGGDGTSGNVANAILAANARTRLGVIPVGTGNDFAKTLRVGDLTIEAIARLSVEPSAAAVDVGRIENIFFLNSCGFGFDVAVLKSLAPQRWLRGNAVYLYSALKQLFGFAGFDAEIESAAMYRHRDRYMMIVIANCPHFGGAFLIAPGADVLDGQLDAICVRNVKALRRLRLLAAATRGTHPGFTEVTVERAEEFTLHFDDVPFYETDGEVHRANSSSVRLQCINRGLRVVTGDGFGSSPVS